MRRICNRIIACFFNFRMPRRRVFTLDEAVELITGDEENVRQVVALPPDVNELTDEENEEGASVNDIPGEIEVEFFQSEVTRDNNELPSVSTAHNEKCKTPRKRKLQAVVKKWKKKEGYTQTIAKLSPKSISETNPELRFLTPFELFRNFLSDELINLIIAECLLYAQQKNDIRFSLTPQEFYVFCGIILLSGYHSLPQQEMYWSRDEDVGVELVARSMSRNRFRDLKRYIHFSDNTTLEKGDKMAKIRPLLDAMNKNLKQYGVFKEQLTIDEQMLPYHGKHPAKQFMLNKPVKFGYKLWVLASSDGYPFHLEVYTGKDTSFEEYSLGERVVRKLLNTVENVSQHEITLDNFFTSYQLLKSLRELGVRATGTIRENRIAKAPLVDSGVMKKKDRGEHDFRVGDGEVLVVKWNDNKPVCVATNHDTVTPLLRQRRFSQSQKAYVTIPQPNVVHNYNRYMGGVDLLDRCLSNYRPVIRGKKWYFPFFSHCLNVFVVASWRIHQEFGGSCSQLDFLRHICRSLIQVSVVKPRPGPSGDTISDIRFDGVGHVCSRGSREGRCKVCKKNTFYCCTKCDVKLHQKCFFQFHEPQ